MIFTKPALTLDEQVALLRARGMIGDPAEMRRRLEVVSYYRLTGYWHHRKQPDDTFRAGTHFDVVWDQYAFDRKLRLLVMDAVERIEVALRTMLSYHQAHEHGPFGYATDPAALPALPSAGQRHEFLGRVADEVKRAKKEVFIQHFQRKYGDNHDLPPIWMASEVLSFGTVVRLWKASPKNVQGPVARAFGVSEKVMESWLWALNEVRNVCAHHGRLWNRELGNKPMVPLAKHHPAWHQPAPPRNDRIFVVLTMCADILARIAPGSNWPGRVAALLAEYPRVPTKNMGFHDGWTTCPIWKGARDGR